MKKYQFHAIAFAVGVLIGLLWKPYEYRTSEHRVYKLNRLTGSAWVSYGVDWKPIRPQDSEQSARPAWQ